MPMFNPPGNARCPQLRAWQAGAPCNSAPLGNFLSSQHSPECVAGIWRYTKLALQWYSSCVILRGGQGGLRLEWALLGGGGPCGGGEVGCGAPTETRGVVWGLKKRGQGKGTLRHNSGSGAACVLWPSVSIPGEKCTQRPPTATRWCGEGRWLIGNKRWWVMVCWRSSNQTRGVLEGLK